MPTADVLDSTMFYTELGRGVPLVFLHGNPTSSYLWRAVLPQIGEPGRCLAPDLIGMGASGKPPIAYQFADHARYLDAWFDALGLDSVLLVGHDWGGALAFDWAARHPGRTRGVAFMETIVRPMSWDQFPESARPVFKSPRTPGAGEAMVLDENIFIERALPGNVATGLTEEDMNAYRRPYPTRDSRRPLLQWPRAMPLDGEPADVVARVEAYDEWLARSPEVPKLLLTFDPGPGTMLGPEMIAWCAANISSLDIAACGPAGHHAPEDQPDAIAAAIAAWADRHHLRSGRPAPAAAAAPAPARAPGRPGTGTPGALAGR
jgi:haloalkane dehalogenase